jgi:hypothetical protein
MCTVKSENEIMVCDISRDDVRRVLSERVGGAFEASTVHGEGTRFTCVDPASMSDFQHSVAVALGWEDNRFRVSDEEATA